VEVEDARHVICEDGLPLMCLQTVRVLARIDQLEEIDDVDEADLQLRQVGAQESGSGKCLVSGDITTGGHDNIRLLTLVVRSEVPDTDTLGAVLDSLVHSEELQMLLLVRDNNVDVVLAAKAVVHSGKEAVGVRRQVDAHDIRALVCDNVKEARILVRKAVVVLSPDGGCEKDVERRDLLPPLDFETLLDPLAVLVHHAVDDVDERLVAVEETVSS